MSRRGQAFPAGYPVRRSYTGARSYCSHVVFLQAYSCMTCYTIRPFGHQADDVEPRVLHCGNCAKATKHAYLGSKLFRAESFTKTVGTDIRVALVRFEVEQ
jgi:hypothetical protein